jgi:hypothetical protein
VKVILFMRVYTQRIYSTKVRNALTALGLVPCT